MRTTVTLDDDLAIRLERLRLEQRRSFKSTINEVVRAGLDTMAAMAGQGAGDAVEYTVPVDLGEPLFGDVSPSWLLADLDEAERIEKLGERDVRC